MINLTPTDLDPRKERAALALAYGYSQSDAAAMAGTTDRTIRRWLANQKFEQLVAAYRARATFEMAARLDTLQLEAVETVAQLMRTGKENTRLAAARVVFDRAAKTREEIHTTRRIATLEAQAIEIEKGSQER